MFQPVFGVPDFVVMNFKENVIKTSFRFNFQRYLLPDITDI